MAQNIEHLQAEQARYTSYTQSAHTRAEYLRDWLQFTAWCGNTGRDPLPATTETVALYITSRLDRGAAITSAIRYTAALNSTHRAAQFPAPADRTVWALIKGCQRMRGERPQPKTALTVGQLREACLLMRGDGLIAVRNRAILVFGFASAMRRSPICALDLEDILVSEQGVQVRIRKDKQDQTSMGRMLAVERGEHPETCTVATLGAWLGLRGDSPGPLFTRTIDGRLTLMRLDSKIVAKIVKQAVKALGVDARTYAGHSLRRGFATAALNAGAGEIAVANHMGHGSLSSLRRYFVQDAWEGNCSGMIGL